MAQQVRRKPKQPRTSNIAIGEADSFDLDGPLEVRECVNDDDYPVSIEGITKGGHHVAISLTAEDVEILTAAFGMYESI